MGSVNEKNPLGLPEKVEGMAAFTEVLGHALDLVETDPEVRAAVGRAKVGNPISVEVVPSADKWSAKMIQRATAASTAWVEGVQNPSRDFKEAAVAASGKWKQKVTEAVQQDRFAKRMAQVDVNQAINTAVQVGPAAYSNGIQARQGKIQAAVAKLQPQVAALKRVVDSMPQDTDAQREQRLLAARKGMIEIGRRLAGGGA